MPELRLLASGAGNPELRCRITLEGKDECVQALELFQPSYEKEVGLVGYTCIGFVNCGHRRFGERDKIRQMLDAGIESHLLVFSLAGQTGRNERINVCDRRFHQAGVSPQLWRTLVGKRAKE